MTLKNNKNKISMLRQQNFTDCGVVCLQSIIRSFGSDISLEQLRVWSGSTRAGTPMLGIIQAANKSGLEADGYEADLQSLRECKDVCILHVVMDKVLDHYIVYWGYDENLKKYIIGDPANGEVEEFAELALDIIWESKFLVLIKPGIINEVKPTNTSPSKYWQWVRDFIKIDTNLLKISLVLGVLVAVLRLSISIFCQKLIDYIFPLSNYMYLFGGIVLLAVLFLLRSCLGYIRQLFLLRLSKDFNVQVIDYFIDKLLHLPKIFFNNRHTGEIMSRINETAKLQSAILQIATNSLIDALVIIAIVITTFIYKWQLGLLTLGWLPFGWVTSKYYSRINTTQKSVMVSHANTESMLVDAVQSASMVKILNRQSMFVNLARHIYGNYQETAFSMNKVAMNIAFWTDIFGAIFLCAILLGCSIFVIQGGMTVGMFFAFVLMADMVVNAASRLSVSRIQIEESKIAFDRMLEFTTLQSECKPPTHPISPPHFRFPKLGQEFM